jgi:hypothetical protein
MTLENGAQPLEELMKKYGLTSQILVEASTDQLSFKMVQKGRKGRRLSMNVQKKILHAVRAAVVAASREAKALGASEAKAISVPSIKLEDLFNYRG